MPWLSHKHFTSQTSTIHSCCATFVLLIQHSLNQSTSSEVDLPNDFSYTHAHTFLEILLFPIFQYGQTIREHFSNSFIHPIHYHLPCPCIWHSIYIIPNDPLRLSLHIPNPRSFLSLSVQLFHHHTIK